MKAYCFLYFPFVTILSQTKTVYVPFFLGLLTVFHFSLLISNVSLEQSSLILRFVPFSFWVSERIFCLCLLATIVLAILQSWQLLSFFNFFFITYSMCSFHFNYFVTLVFRQTNFLLCAPTFRFPLHLIRRSSDYHDEIRLRDPSVSHKAGHYLCRVH